MEHEKQQAGVWRDLYEPGWREREAERVRKFTEAIQSREPLVRTGQQVNPCGECRLQPGERCDICGAQHLCNYPDCSCPFDAPADPNWCARGLPKTPNAIVSGAPADAKE